LLDDVKVIRFPPMFQRAYLFDWEYAYTESDVGYPYLALAYHDQSEKVFCYTWEVESIARSNAATGDPGTYYTQPWEAWLVNIPGTPPPAWLPDGFHNALFIAYDRDPLRAQTFKEIQRDDRTWKARKGEPFFYYRDEKLENHIVIFPTPSDVAWVDIEGEGMLLFDSDDETDTETGTVIDAEAAISSEIDGVGVDVFDPEDNLLIVYSKNPIELVDDVDESQYSRFLRKYLEYDTLEAAFKANTDGYAPSLADFWGMRKQIGYRAIKMYKTKRLYDRDYQLRTPGAPARRTKKRPRLPDSYPAI
jgi:hypothetical protein